MITFDVAARVLRTVDAGLIAGLGNPTPGDMCVEAAVCYAMKEPHGDNPSCVSPVLLAEYAESIVQILIEMKAPGCQWLDLAPLEAA